VGRVARLATPDPALPLFVVEATEEETRSAVSLQYLIDLRPGRARVPALLECVEVVAWGGCGAFDAGYGSVSGPIACVWEAAQGDFHCREMQGIGTLWGDRSAVREYLLLSKREPDTVVASRVSSQLSELVAAAASAPSAHREVQTLGPVHSFATLPRPGGGRLVLMGAAGVSSSFGARFLLGVVENDGAVRAGTVDESELSPSFWAPGELDDGSAVVHGTPTPGELSFRAFTLASTKPGPTVLRVRVMDRSVLRRAGAASGRVLDRNPGSGG
jgi:hypothetical protein